MQTINPRYFKYYQQTISRFEWQWWEMWNDYICVCCIYTCVCFSYKRLMKMSWCCF